MITLSRLRFSLIPILVILCSAPLGAISITLSPSHPATPVGKPILFDAAAVGVDASGAWYRFRVRTVGGDYRVIRDFGPSGELNWSTLQEGSFEIEVAARSLSSGDTTTATTIVQVAPVVTNGQPQVSPTSNSLVFLYSAPACPAGQRMRVEFQAADTPGFNTPYQNCKTGATMNFYLAGLKGDTSYVARHWIDTGTQFLLGPEVTFTTGDVPAGLPASSVVVMPSAGMADPILLGGPLEAPPVAYDLSGNVLWYGPPSAFTITRPEQGGRFWGIIQDFGGDPTLQIIRKYDLIGVTLLETNAARVNEQLKVLGKRQITAFHHEARTLPDGRIVALASVEQILTDVQGSGAVDVIGDMIIVFDTNLNVLWTWDTFDNLDVHRAAVLGETCVVAATCPPFILAKQANDWTHGNSVSQTPDGDLLYSSRHQDWLIKISYDNGEGDGHIIWKLGKDGDFQFLSSDPYPWFSHQHDANFDITNPTQLMVFDDGNTRVMVQNQGYSRGQVLQMDEPNRMATPVLNADVGLYSLALGSAQKLSDGNYHFDFGYVVEPSGLHAYSVEVDPSGKVLYNAKSSAPMYRTVRMTDMYTPN